MWSGCQWVLTTYRTGLSVRLRMSPIKSWAQVGRRCVSTTRTSSRFTNTAALEKTPGLPMAPYTPSATGTMSNDCEAAGSATKNRTAMTVNSRRVRRMDAIPPADDGEAANLSHRPARRPMGQPAGRILSRQPGYLPSQGQGVTLNYRAPGRIGTQNPGRRLRHLFQ